MIQDSDNESTVTESCAGKYRRQDKELWQKTQKKYARNSSAAKHEPFIACQHTNGSAGCSATKLTQDEVKGMNFCFLIIDKNTCSPHYIDL